MKKYFIDGNSEYRFAKLDGSEDQYIQEDWEYIGEDTEDASFEIPKTPEQIKASIVTAVQAHLDNQAQSKGYDSILSATSYAGYPNDFQVEGIKFGTWRANVWKYCYQQLAEIESGERPIIPTVEEFITELPTL